MFNSENKKRKVLIYKGKCGRIRDKNEFLLLKKKKKLKQVLKNKREKSVFNSEKKGKI